MAIAEAQRSRTRLEVKRSWAQIPPDVDFFSSLSFYSDGLYVLERVPWKGATQLILLKTWCLALQLGAKQAYYAQICQKTLLAMTDRQTNVLVSIFSDVCRKLIFSEIENVNEVKKVGERKKEPTRLLLPLESKEASPTKRATKKLA